MRFAASIVLLGLALSGCDGCGANAGLDASGARGYVRCLAASQPKDRTLQLGGLRLVLEGRELRIEGATRPLRIAALAGAGFVDPPRAGGGFDTLLASKPQLVFLIGGMGDTPERALQVAERLAALKVPVVFVAGGRDARDHYAPALASHEGIVDATALHRVRIGTDTFVPLAGSSEGRYALHDGACGFGLPDLKDLASQLGPAAPGERRWLLSWEAPAGPLTRAPPDIGSRDLAELATRIGAGGGLHGWPELYVGAPHAAAASLPPDAPAAADFGLVVPRLWGPWQQRGDGERTAPGFALLELSEAGLQLISHDKK